LSQPIADRRRLRVGLDAFGDGLHVQAAGHADRHLFIGPAAKT